MRNKTVPLTVIKRLPRYYRYLENLLHNNVHRISSKELAEMMNFTASQIRQDLNCFGGFGQQGYGYNVADLFGAIGKILGIERHFKIIIIGGSNLGKTIATHIDFDGRGFALSAIFEKDPALIGERIQGLTVKSIDDITRYCETEHPVAVALCIPDAEAEKLVPKLVALGINAFWNFSNYDIDVSKYANVIAENIHLADSMMTLCFQVKEMQDAKVSATAEL